MEESKNPSQLLTNEVAMPDYQFSTSSENISSNGGFSFVDRLLSSNAGMSRWDAVLPGGPQRRHGSEAVVRGMLLLMCAGCPNYADVEKFRDDCLFRAALGGRVPSEATLRQRLDALADAEWREVVDECVASQLTCARLTPVEVMPELPKLVPVDIDVSVLEDAASRKEGVSMTYHRVNGFAPIFAYAGREGYMVAAELRPGSQHSEKGAVEFLERTVGILKKAGHAPETLLVRVDSGHDAADFIGACLALGVHFIVKHNLRRESPEQLLDSIRYYEEPERCRPGKTIYRGIRSELKPAGLESFQGFLAVEAVERTSLADGQELLLPQVDLESWWTDLPCSVQQCVAMYHDHGTSEQFHSELKSDLGLELLPSGKFATNALVLGLAAIAFNCLRRIGQLALDATQFPEGRRAPARFRLRTVLLALIKVGCKLVNHARHWLLKFGRNCFNFLTMKEIYAKC